MKKLIKKITKEKGIVKSIDLNRGIKNCENSNKFIQTLK